MYDMYEYLRGKRNITSLQGLFGSMSAGVKAEIDKHRPKPPIGTIIEGPDGSEMAYTKDGWEWLLPDNTVPKGDSE